MKKKKNIGACCRFIFGGIFLTQESNPSLLHLLHWQADSLQLHYLGNTPIYFIYLFIWLYWVLFATHGIFSL